MLRTNLKLKLSLLRLISNYTGEIVTCHLPHKHLYCALIFRVPSPFSAAAALLCAHPLITRNQVNNRILPIRARLTSLIDRMSGEVDKSQHILPLDQPVSCLEVETAFAGLTPKEKLYAHHISKAAWVGGLVTLLQTSPESGPVFVLLHKLFSAQNPADLKAAAVAAGFTEEEVTALLVYAAGVFSNAGNYKGFGDSKIIPGIEADRLEELLKLSPIWGQLQPLWAELQDKIYDLSGSKTCLGYPPHGCTTYLSKNCDASDSERVQNWLKTQQIQCYNTRLFKTVKGDQIIYEIRQAAKEKGEIKRAVEGNFTYVVTKGDYAPIMGKIAGHLEDALPHVANETQAEMLKYYIKSFTSGNLEDHIEGSRFWIKDKAPAVETYIGFIETYRDPAGVRGEFEGFVAAVNRSMSEKFTNLVAKAEEFLPLLPWSKGFEKDTFLRPDFTSLDVLTFAGSGIPAGINIPNCEGFLFVLTE